MKYYVVINYIDGNTVIAYVNYHKSHTDEQKEEICITKLHDKADIFKVKEEDLAKVINYACYHWIVKNIEVVPAY